MLLAPVVVMVAVVRKSADTGGTVPASFTHSTRRGDAALPAAVEVLIEALVVSACW